MNNSTLSCQDTQRRHKIRKEGLNGIDYLEVSDDQHRLIVYFLGKAPENLTKENVRILGGRRIRNIQIVDLKLCIQEDPERDDCMIVSVDRPGDFSTYSLCLVALDQDGQPTDQAFPDFDPRYTCLDFSFKVGCPSDLDCKHQKICPPKVYEKPEVNYLAKDYASFRQLILDRLALIMPDWQERHIPDLGIALVELLAYAGDHLSYYQDAVATEAYLDTARQRISVRRHVRLVDYPMHEGCNARTWVCVATDVDSPSLNPDNFYFITGHEDILSLGCYVLNEDDLKNIPPSQYEVFEPLREKPDDLQFYQAHTEIHFYTWGDRECCLPRGATTATLKDEWEPGGQSKSKSITPRKTRKVQKPEPPDEPAPEPEEPLRKLRHLQPGDFLLFEEVIGPKTNNPADADPTRRHVVRLTHVKEVVDELYQQPVLEIAWAEEDALPFPLCISAIGPAPICAFVENISIVRGNVLLVDHGRYITREDLGIVAEKDTIASCKGEDHPSDIHVIPDRFRPMLQKPSITFHQPLPSNGPASKLFIQDPRQAEPWIRLFNEPCSECASAQPEEPLPAESSGDDECPPELAREQAAESVQADETDPPLITEWTVRRDLLGSGAQDRHFVAEMDNERHAHLRFGNGESGQLPEAGTRFLATYRVGNGPTGNIGAEAISYIVLRNITLSGVDLRPRNPLPARGGTAPEPLTEVKLYAPYAFRTILQRAITADDYAALVMRKFKNTVQRAAARLRWTGSWYEMLITIDPLGQTEADEKLLNAIREFLHCYRRIGHDVVVKSARQVPLDLEMIVCVLPDYLRGHVKAALLERLSDRQLPDGQRGFFHPDNLTFGEGIFVSKLVAAARAVPGVENIQVTKLERLYEGPNQEIENGLLPLGPFEIVRLDNDPSFPEHGRLWLNMRGGR